MVALTKAVASNMDIAATFPDGLVAVFVGGTSGVGEYTLKKFAKYVPKPRAYVVGRSQEAADRILAECRGLNPDGTFEFIKADISLLKNVDKVCEQIKNKESAINLLFLTQGSMAFESTTSEGLPIASSLTMHSRTLFILNLLPLIQKASSLRRVVSVLAATYEGAIDVDNIAARGFPLYQRRNQTSAVQSLLLQELGRRAPSVSFVHTLPGLVKGGIMREMEMEVTLRLSVMIAISRLMAPLIETPPDECGERHLFFATNSRYAPRNGTAAAAGVVLGTDMTAAVGSDGETASGVYSIDNKGESASSKVVKLLLQYKDDGTAAKVWEYIRADFNKVLGRDAMLPGN